MTDMDRLLDIMRALRSIDHGCPWDRAQTFESIVPHTLEEAYEVADVIEQGALGELSAELGDLLFQVIFYCQIATERGLFGFADVADRLARKLIDRHPHVFAGASIENAQAQTHQWEAFKARERRARAATSTISELDDVPLTLPALTRAHKLQKRAARVGFDWDDVRSVRDKIDEELDELMDAVDHGIVDGIDEELGDLLFACVNLSRHLKVDPEGALRRANQKFERRFRFIENRLGERGLEVTSVDLQQLDTLWDEAKSTGL